MLYEKIEKRKPIKTLPQKRKITIKIHHTMITNDKISKKYNSQIKK